MRFRTAIRKNTAKSVPLIPITTRPRSFLLYSRTRASSSSLRVISSLLLHVPDHEDEAELGQGDHAAHDRVQEREDERALVLADEGHDRHDDDQEQGERDDDGHERLREHPQRLHLLPHLELVLLPVLLRLELEVRLQLPAARARRDDALEEILELRARAAPRAPPQRGEDVDPEELRVPRDPLRRLR